MFSKRLDQSSFPRTMEEGPFLGGESVGGCCMSWAGCVSAACLVLVHGAERTISDSTISFLSGNTVVTIVLMGKLTVCFSF